MLLKIYTCQNTIKVIDKIDDVEIHQGEYKIDNFEQLYDAEAYGPGLIRGTSRFPETIESYDWDTTDPKMTPACETTICNLVKYVDYLRNGEWRRVAIQQYAYLCNDEGKTVAKIGA